MKSESAAPEAIAKIAGTGEKIAEYDVPDHQMAVGSTLGSPKAVMVLKATGAVEKIYSPDAGETMIGTIVVHHWDEDTGIWLHGQPGNFQIHPARQDHTFSLANDVAVRERLFVLSTKKAGEEPDPPAVYYSIELENQGDMPARVGTYPFVELKGSIGPDVMVDFDRRRNAFVIANHSNPDLVRVVGCSTKPDSFEVSNDHAMTFSSTAPGKLTGELEAKGSDPLGVFHFSNTLRPGQKARICLKVSFSVHGRDKALKNFDAAPEIDEAMDATSAYYGSILGRAVLITPDSEVNRGVLWAKANMLRVQLKGPTGWCFVNDPTRSNNSVARDTAWFAFGADYVMSIFARESLLYYIEHLEETGMAVEYYDIRNGKPADYRMNVNDDTPLLILGLWHHYNTSGDRDFLAHVYPNAVRAARHLLSQRNEMGLVWCTADGEADWGIVGWRNVIKGYRLSGATTELNSECYAALRTIAQMALVLSKHDDVQEFNEHADGLRDAINQYLFDKERKQYYLNIDLDGSIRTDVTGDMVFPVMFGVADDDVASNIINRLSVDEFWTEGGMRTVPRAAVQYSPTNGYGLLGGVWVNETIWFAMAAAPFNSEVMANALSTSFRYYSQDPRRNNTVPGQFSEWLHGETLVNQGMMLSPWFAPQYLWAAVEGVAGLNVAGAEPSISPRPAPSWKWLGMRNLPFRQECLTWFAARQGGKLRVYSNSSFRCPYETEVYERDCSDDVEISGEALATIGFERGREYAICLGNTKDHGMASAVRLKVAEETYRARVYNSLREAWVDSTITAEEFRHGLPVQLDRKGFCVIELRPAI